MKPIRSKRAPICSSESLRSVPLASFMKSLFGERQNYASSLKVSLVLFKPVSRKIWLNFPIQQKCVFNLLILCAHRTRVSKIASTVHRIQPKSGKVDWNSTFYFDQGHSSTECVGGNDRQLHQILRNRFGRIGSRIAKASVVNISFFVEIKKSTNHFFLFAFYRFFPLSNPIKGFHSIREIPSDIWLQLWLQYYLWAVCWLLSSVCWFLDS